MNEEKAITNQKAFDFVVMLLNSGFISLAVFADATGLSYEEAGTYLKEDADIISRAELEKPEPTSDIYDGLLSTPNAIVAGEEQIIIDRQAIKIKRLQKPEPTSDAVKI